MVDRSASVRAPSNSPPPVAVAIPLKARGTDSPYHEVVAGDTLYSIAWQYGQDYQAVARRNHLVSPYVVQVGERLRVLPYPEESATTVVSPEIDSPQRAIDKPVLRKAAMPESSYRDSVRWQWPVVGAVLAKFEADTDGRKGIDIGGKSGQTVSSAADGVVVYTGSGLIGYGQLIIIRHSKNYLSAYGFNRKLIVREGEQVLIGQAIARMGNTGTSQPMLHFEIRKDGKPVDPMRYLPAR